jgi:hypothetical protein
MPPAVVPPAPPAPPDVAASLVPLALDPSVDPVAQGSPGVRASPRRAVKRAHARSVVVTSSVHAVSRADAVVTGTYGKTYVKATAVSRSSTHTSHTSRTHSFSPPIPLPVPQTEAGAGAGAAGGSGSSSVAAYAPWLLALVPGVLVAALVRRRRRPRSLADEIETPPG